MVGNLEAVTLFQPELVGLISEPRVDDTAVKRKDPVRDAKVTEANADGEHGKRVPQRDTSIERRVGPRGHDVARTAVLVADVVTERVEMRELPGVEQTREAPGAGHGEGAGRGPAHERRDGTHNGADPGVDNGLALEGRVEP